MEVILKEDVDTLGQRGQTVKVSPGYGRNFLLPRGLAVEISAGNLRQLDHERRGIERRHKKEQVAAESVRTRVESVQLSIARKVGEGDALYGSVTNGDVATALSAAGINIDKRRILLEDPIKSLGSFEIRVKLHHDVVAKVHLVVIKEG